MIRTEERECSPSMVVPLSHIHFDANTLIQYLDNLVLNCPRLLLNYTIDEYYRAARLREITHVNSATSAVVKAGDTPPTSTSDWNHLTGVYQHSSRAASSLEPTLLKSCNAQSNHPKNSSPCASQSLRSTGSVKLNSRHSQALSRTTQLPLEPLKLPAVTAVPRSGRRLAKRPEE